MQYDSKHSVNTRYVTHICLYTYTLVRTKQCILDLKKAKQNKTSAIVLDWCHLLFCLSPCSGNKLNKLSRGKPVTMHFNSISFNPCCALVTIVVNPVNVWWIYKCAFVVRARALLFFFFFVLGLFLFVVVADVVDVFVVALTLFLSSIQFWKMYARQQNFTESFV